jgi:hypothetical protein
MEESSPLTDNLLHIKLSESDFEDAVTEMQSLDYTRERTYGFEVSEIHEDIVNSNLVITTPTKVQKFDEERGEVIEDTEKRTKVIPFRLDFKNNLLEVFSNKKDTKKVKTRISELAKWNVSISDIEIDVEDMRNLASNEGLDAEISSLKIDNFSLRENTEGNCFLNVYDEDETEDLISEYTDDISYISLSIEEKGEEIKIGIYRSGSIRIYSDANDDKKILRKIKKVLVRKG